MDTIDTTRELYEGVVRFAHIAFAVFVFWLRLRVVMYAKQTLTQLPRSVSLSVALRWLADYY